MTENGHGSLLSLLQLLHERAADADSSAPGDLSAVPTPFSDPLVENRWRRLCEAAGGGPESLSTAEVSVSAELLAAFVEGGLSPREAARVEHLCWRSPQTLSEVISAHLAARSRESLPPPTPALTERLLCLAPLDVAEEEAAAAWAEPVPPPVNSPTEPLIQPSGPEAQRLVDRLRRKRRGASWVWWAGAAGVVALGLCIAAAVRLWRTPETLPRLGPEPQIATPGDPGSQPPEPPQAPTPPKTPPDSTPGKRLPPQTAGVRPNDTRPERPRVEPPDDLDPLLPVEHEPRPPTPRLRESQDYLAVVLDWERVEGLLVSRDKEDGAWQGIQSDYLEPDASDYATLPGSWASGRTARFGEMVLDADTSVALAGNHSSPDRLDVELNRGRMAFRDAPADRQLHLTIGQAACVVRPVRPTTFGVVRTFKGPQLLVRRGELMVGQTRLRQGRQLSWSRDGFGGVETTRENSNWLDRPDHVDRIPTEMQETLLRSHDVNSELLRLAARTDARTRRLPTTWTLALSPETTIADALSSPDAQTRTDAIRWVLSRDPREPDLRLAWRALARKTGDAQMVRSFYRWTVLAHQGHRVEQAESQNMLRGLNHERLAFRQVSIFFLELAFGRRARYQPDAPLDVRRQGVQAWTAALRRHFATSGATGKQASTRPGS